MAAPGVVLVIVTVCPTDKLPDAGVNVGVAATARLVVAAAVLLAGVRSSVAEPAVTVAVTACAGMV
jgi:hypothetical protein